MNVRSVCAELSTFEKINIELLIFHRETNKILGSRSEKKAQVSVDLSKNIFLFGLRNQFPFPNNNFNWFLSQFVVIITDHR